MTRGEVRWYTFKAPDKRRPVLILTRNSAIDVLSNVTIAPITTTIRNIPSEVCLTVEDGLRSECVANFDNIQTIPKNRIGDLLTILPSARMQEVNNAISFALGLNEFSY